MGSTDRAGKMQHSSEENRRHDKYHHVGGPLREDLSQSDRYHQTLPRRVKPVLPHKH